MPIGELFALAGAIFFGSANIFIRKGMGGREGADPLFMTSLLNVGLFGLGMTATALLGKSPELNGPGLLSFLLAGALTTLFGRATFYGAIRRLGPSRAVSYRVTSPAFVLVVAFLFLQERVGLVPLIGAVAVLAGLWSLTQEVARADSEAEATSSHNPGPTAPQRLAPGVAVPGLSATTAGIGLGLLSAMLFGMGHIMRKVGLGFIPAPLLGAVLGSSVALAGVSFGALAQGRFRQLVQHNIVSMSPPLILAGVLTGLGQLSVFASFNFTQVSTASVISATEPMMTIGLSALLLRAEERISARVLASVAVTCVGVAAIVAFR